MIGASLSFCVSDIARGNIQYDQVEKIISSTNVPDAKSWECTIGEYKEAYWHNFPGEAESIARKLIAENKIVQPRLEGKACPCLINNAPIWYEKEKGIPLREIL